VIGLLNGTAVDQQVTYDDWGVATVSGSADNRLLFKGLLWEGTYTGLYYVRARWYDPELGRFISEDPQGINEGTNYYAFGASDALNHSDPSGHSWLSKELGRFKKNWKKNGPVFGFLAMTVGAMAGGMPLGAAFIGAMDATLGAAMGSAVGAGVQSIASGTRFSVAFKRNFNNSGWGFVGSVAFASAFGGGVAELGRNTPFQGFVRSKKASTFLPKIFKEGGLTFGPGALFTTALLNEAETNILASMAQHEFGHTLQFLGMSTLGAFINPWVPYFWVGGLSLWGGPWEEMASSAGNP